MRRYVEQLCFAVLYSAFFFARDGQLMPSLASWLVDNLEWASRHLTCLAFYNTQATTYTYIIHINRHIHIHIDIIHIHIHIHIHMYVYIYIYIVYNDPSQDAIRLKGLALRGLVHFLGMPSE